MPSFYRIPECSDLTVINGSCNPYAVVSVCHGKGKVKEVKRTTVKKKTICPQFDECFNFYVSLIYMINFQSPPNPLKEIRKSFW